MSNCKELLREARAAIYGFDVADLIARIDAFLATPAAPADAVDAMARRLFDAWAKSEPDHPVTKNPASYVSTFADMARAALAAPAAGGSPLGRDADWTLAIADALGTDSGYFVPIAPEPDAFRKLFAAVRGAAPAAPAGGELVTALQRISLASQNSMSTKGECGRIAREALSAWRAQEAKR